MESKLSVEYLLTSESFINYALGIESDWNPTEKTVEANKEAIETALEILQAPFDVKTDLSANDRADLKRRIIESI